MRAKKDQEKIEKVEHEKESYYVFNNENSEPDICTTKECVKNCCIELARNGLSDDDIIVIKGRRVELKFEVEIIE